MVVISKQCIDCFQTAGPPSSSKQKSQQSFVEEPHQLLKALPAFNRARKRIHPNTEDEEPLNFDQWRSQPCSDARAQLFL